MSRSVLRRDVGEGERVAGGGRQRALLRWGRRDNDRQRGGNIWGGGQNGLCSRCVVGKGWGKWGYVGEIMGLLRRHQRFIHHGARVVKAVVKVLCGLEQSREDGASRRHGGKVTGVVGDQGQARFRGGKRSLLWQSRPYERELLQLARTVSRSREVSWRGPSIGGVKRH